MRATTVRISVVAILVALLLPSPTASMAFAQGSTGDPGIAKITNVACGTTDTYFVLTVDGKGVPDHYLYRVSIDAPKGAKIAQVMPVVGPKLASKITAALVLSVAETPLKLTGISTLVDIAKAFAEEWQRKSNTDIRSFGMKMSGTAAQPRLQFIVWGTRGSKGSLTITTEWARNGNETVSRSGPFKICP